MTSSAALGLEIVPSGDRSIAATSPWRQSKTMAAVVLGSMLAPAAIMSLLLVGGPAQSGGAHEVTVELVEASSKPKVPKPETSEPETPKPASEKEAPKQQAEQPSPSPEKPRTPEPAKVAAAAGKAAPAARTAAPTPAQPGGTTAQLDQLKRQLVNELLQQHAVAEAATEGERHVVRPEAANAATAKPSGFTSNAKSLVPIALPGTMGDAGEAVGFEDLVFSQLAKAKDLSRRRGLPGTAGVRFTVDDRGGLSSVELIRPSGDKALDDEATSIVRRAAPFPIPPKGAERTFVISVDFVLDD